MTDQDAAEQPVLTEQRSNVLLITLNRPQVRNAVNAALARLVMAGVKLKFRVQLLTGAVPLLVITRLAPKPPFHWPV